MSMGAMLDMMERMMGKNPGGNQSGESPGQQGGEGQTGDSDAPNTDQESLGGGESSEERRVPKSSGRAGVELPSEFRKALDAYNRPR